jgi:hypothetical protein
MGVCFNQGQILGRGDLDIFLKNSDGNPQDAYFITFALYCIDPASGAEVLVGNPAWIPAHPSVGEYYAAIQVPPGAGTGDYVIRWTVQEFAGSPSVVIAQEFGVVGQNVETGAGSGYSACEAELIRKLRTMLRDNNPDRNYRFRPPEGEGEVGCYNKVNGYIWEDSELFDYLCIAMDKFNSFPPSTAGEICNLDQLCQKHPEWKAAMLWGAVVNASLALAFNWTADEFGYSIGGISLDLEKSSKYLQLKDNAEQQFLQLTEAKARTVKYIRGLAQPRFGRGIRSAFGPHVGRGVLSPRNFV